MEDSEPAVIECFKSIKQYADKQKTATDFDLEKQMTPIKAHNESGRLFDAWVIAVPPDEDPSLGFIFRLRVSRFDVIEVKEPWNNNSTRGRGHTGLSGSKHHRRKKNAKGRNDTKREAKESDEEQFMRTTQHKFTKLMPMIGETCQFMVVNGEQESEWFYAERTRNHVQLPKKAWPEETYIEFKVSGITREWSTILKPIMPADEDDSELQPGDETVIKVKVKLHLSYTTYNAEIGALTRLQRRASRLQKEVFNFVVFLEEPSSYVDLSAERPHMVDPEKVVDEHLRARLVTMYNSLDDHQRAAYRRLSTFLKVSCSFPGGLALGKLGGVLL
ncbi:hypothetical protein B0H66DRAFT_544325 [Apodospora peruviana]|uniref:Uncharacterized protein n=1 Tax=Apodospora peruviana TaxID=516989 RepID=A0AAE0MG83_9PEZI|nr:hypothetical protein B0H66DRAFT_544325 [Apodospora peruviana]